MAKKITKRKKMSLKSILAKTILHIVLMILVAYSVLPIIWIALNSFKDNSQIYVHPFNLPNPVITDNYKHMITTISILPKAFANSLIYAVVTVVIVLIMASMVAFYLSKISTGSFLYNYFLVGMTIPIQAIIIPLFVDIKSMGLNGSKAGLILVYVVINLSFAVFILTGFMRSSIPDEILDAAIIDGCSGWKVFFRIVIPLSKSGLATAGMFVFLNVWQEFLFAMVLVGGTENTTLNMVALSLRGQYSSDQGLISTGVVILTVPLLIIYACFQEQVVKGLTAGAVKG